MRNFCCRRAYANGCLKIIWRISLSDVVDNLDLSAMEAVYGNEKRGQPPYDPRMMTKVLVYGYCVAGFSSRRIERRLVEDIAFRAAGNQPNFRTISDFRKLHLKTLAGQFEQVLKIALDAGALKPGRVVVDGTKIQANASKHKAMSYDRMREKDKQIRAEVKQLLEQAEAADAEEDVRHGKDCRGDELPEELQRRENRLKKIREAKRALQARGREGAVAEGAEPKAGRYTIQFADSPGFREGLVIFFTNSRASSFSMFRFRKRYSNEALYSANNSRHCSSDSPCRPALAEPYSFSSGL
jgi:transposase